MDNWTCDRIADNFGNEQVMLWSYGAREALDAKGKRLPKYLKLKSHRWFSGFSPAPALPASAPLPSKAPLRASYHWHPYTWFGGGSGDDPDPRLRWHQNEPLATKRAQRRIKASYDLPKNLLPPSPVNSQSFKERIEFFLGPPASGADLHVDSVCEPILSVQVCGSKRWWLLPMPPYNHSSRTSAADFWRRQEYRPSIWELELNAGDALLFPTGMAHHTEAVGDGCSVSASLQFRHPFAVRFIRDFAARLMFSKENSFCFVEVWSVFLTGYFRGFVRMQKAVQSRARKHAEQTDLADFILAEASAMFSAIDVDSGGSVSLGEITQHLRAEVQAMQRLDDELVEFDVQLEAEDWMACHDLNSSGEVAQADYVRTMMELGNLYVRSQAEGACDEGCDTPLPKAKRQKAQPVDAYPGAAFDKRKRWEHDEL
eukprot:TRINITY_DN50721_c0_g1_i1.p1 TRINITY_DN50721_c0_g1~~TRINITY_DN50721_c0_g1_i1.p1  ORF type:complete len:428 (-),score=77.69 TRINITY_DN50721_c0_g1_i1:423-1706(-)